jgi:hypothetical protein
MGTGGGGNGGKADRRPGGAGDAPVAGATFRDAQTVTAERDRREAVAELGPALDRFNMQTEPESDIYWGGRSPDEYVEPSSTSYAAPRSEQWFIARIAHLVAWRLVNDINHRSRTVLGRLLFGLQRFPRMTPGLAVSVYWREGDEHGVIQLDSEIAAFTHCSTRLEYFMGSHQLFHLGVHLLKDDERAQFLIEWVSNFDALADKARRLHFEDLSDGPLIDHPPVLWPGAGWVPGDHRSRR